MVTHKRKIAKIVSGGQTGADRGGLEAALYCGEGSGWVPKGRKAEDGVIPAKYDGLRETKFVDYRKRTEANVVDSDATVVFTRGKPTGGSKLTVELAKKHKRPYLIVDISEPARETVKKAAKWLETKCPDACVLKHRRKP